LRPASFIDPDEYLHFFGYVYGHPAVNDARYFAHDSPSVSAMSPTKPAGKSRSLQATRRVNNHEGSIPSTRSIENQGLANQCSKSAVK